MRIGRTALLRGRRGGQLERRGEVKANKVILCARSVYFAGVFNNNIIKSEDASNMIPVPSTKEAVESMIKYLYTGIMEYKEFTLKELLDLLKLFELMREENLFSAVEEFTVNKIRNREFSHEKILLMASSSEKFNFEIITEGVLNLIRDDIKEIAYLPEVKYLTISLLEKLILVHEAAAGEASPSPRSGPGCCGQHGQHWRRRSLRPASNCFDDNEAFRFCL